MKKYRRSLLIFIVIILILFYYNDHSTSPLNVVLIYTNCFNKNRIHYFGNSYNTTPNIDKFAQRSFVFNNYFTPACYTEPCTYELFTSNDYPQAHPDYWTYIPNVSFQFLKKKGYSFIFPRSIFGKTMFKSTSLKQPFILVEHPDTLHDPYDPTFKRIDSFTFEPCHIISRHVKNNYRFSKNCSEFFGNVFGYYSLINTEDINNWNDLETQLRSSSQNSKTAFLKRYIRNDMSTLSSSELKHKFLTIINNAISINGNILDHILFLENDIQIGDVILKNNSVDKITGLHKIFFINFMHFFNIELHNTLFLENEHNIVIKNINKASHFSIMKLQLSKLALAGIIYPELEDAILHKIDDINHPLNRDSMSEIVRKYNSSYSLSSIDILRNYYDETLIEFDAYFGKVIDFIEKSGLSHNTIIVLAGDHGDALGEHDNIGHEDDYLYNENINPPLMIYIPGYAHRSINATIRTKDIFPTLVDILGYDTKNMKKNTGKSLKNDILGNSSSDITAISKGIYKTAIIKHNRWKLIYDRTDDTTLLFDLQKDRQETNDISEAHPEITAELLEDVIHYY